MSYLPKKEDILKHALAKRLQKDFTVGLPSITPEPEELKETGEYAQSQYELMSPNVTQISEQTKYLTNMASELGLRVLPERDIRANEQLIRGLKWNLRRFQRADQKLLHATSLLRPSQPSRRLPVKRHRNHTSRTSKSMRSLRHIKNVKVFSFPDSVWKVRHR